MPRMVNIDRQTPMLLPPDLRDWVPEDDMVHFVLEAIEGMKLPSLRVNRRGSGSPQYPPRMMLALLVYCYSNGIFSSRRIERATYRDVAVRFLAGDTHPDHDTICKFRRENFDAIGEAFLQVLQLARQMGVLKIGTVSVDGTHIRANASKNRNVQYDRAGELEKQVQADIAELMSKAESADQEDANDGQTIPDEIARRERLRARMAEARAALEARAKERAASEQTDIAHEIVLGINEAITRTRAIARGLCPIGLSSDGLLSGLHDLAHDVRKRTGIHCRVMALPGLRVEDNLIATHLC